MREISELNSFREDLRRKWVRRSERNSGSGFGIGDEQRVVLLDAFWLVEAGTYKRSLTCHSTVPVELVETHFESV